MMDIHVQAQQEDLSRDFAVYLKDRKSEIRKRVERAHKLGPMAAAPVEEQVAHALHATVQEGWFEATVGSDDKAPVNFLERGIRASRAVCRVLDANRTHLGTGFLIGPRLLVTNNHVLWNPEMADGAIAEFNFEADADEIARKPLRFALDPGALFVTSPRNRRDFTLIGVAATGEGGEALAHQGWLPLDELKHKILEGQPTIVLQHADGQMKQICLFESECTFRDEAAPYILYSNDTDFGASGSPVFNRFWQVVALHHASVETGEEVKGRPVVNNRGIRVSAIFAALRGGIDIENLDKAPVTASVARALQILDDPLTKKNGRPFDARPAVSTTDVVAGFEAGQRRWTVVRVKPVGKRSGYSEKFLGSDKAIRVPLPRIPDWMAEDVTPVIGGGTVLKYQHYSLVMSKSRRQAIFTAVNVNGARMMRLDRKDRDPDNPIEPGIVPEAAADTWYYDDRIPVEDQLGPRFYDLSSFDFGHLVRRLDPVWGPAKDPVRLARVANDDTFYMTNCSPQEVRFHRGRPLSSDVTNWTKLEEAVLDVVDDRNRKVSILTGPVLDPRDPSLGGVKVPQAYWKIVAYVDAGRLRAHGFLLWQTQEIASAEVKFEAALSFPSASGPVALREIARLTGLDFGPLFEADVLG